MVTMSRDSSSFMAIPTDFKCSGYLKTVKRAFCVIATPTSRPVSAKLHFLYFHIQQGGKSYAVYQSSG